MKIAREGNTVKNILLCFPVDEPSFRVAVYSFRKFGDTILNDIQIVLLIPNQYRKLLHFRFGQVITYDYNSEKNVIMFFVRNSIPVILRSSNPNLAEISKR